MNKKNLLLILLFLVSFLFHIRVFNINLNPYDESVILVGAERILNGEIPYKDFFLMYTPGQYYVLAALFKTFGVSVLNERIYDIIIKSLLAVVVFLVIRLLSSNKYAFTGWAMALLWSGYINFAAYPVYPALLFIFISVYLLLLHFKQGRIVHSIICALSIVIAILFRHDLGGMAALAIAFVLLLRRVMKVDPSWRPLLSYAGSGIIVGAPFVFYFFFYSNMQAVIRNLILFPLSEFQEFQSIPYPTHLSIFTMPFFVFPVVLLIGVAMAIIFMRRNYDTTLSFGILTLSLLGIVFFKQASARSDIVHLLPLGLLSVTLAPVLLSAALQGMSFSARQRGLIVILFIAVFGITLYKPVLMRIQSIPEKYRITVFNPDTERIKYTRLRDEDIKKVAAYIKKVTSEDDYIYSGLKDHDALLFNDALIYFLAERRPATRYHEMNPGFTDTLTVQEEMVSELKKKNVRLIVLISGLWNKEPASSRPPVDVLDTYILTHYELRKRFGKYEIWMRKS